MASTLNLFALDRDFPASRQLQVVVETNLDNNNKKENRLLVTDNKSHKILQEIKEVLESQGTGGGVTSVPEIYPTADIFEGTTSSTSKLVNVVNVDKISIYYSDGPIADGPIVEGHSIRVIGRLGEPDTDDIYSDIVGTFTGTEVELYRFFPKLNSIENKNKFNVIDLSVNGVSSIYLEITADDVDLIQAIRDSPAQAFVSAQYLNFSTQAIGDSNGGTNNGGTTTCDLSGIIEGLETTNTTLDDIKVGTDNLSEISTTLGNIDITSTNKLSNIVSELEQLNIAYQFTNHYLGRSYNLFIQNTTVFIESIDILEDNFTNNNTYYPIFSLWNSSNQNSTDPDNNKIIKINKIVVNLNKSLLIQTISKYENEFNNEQNEQLINDFTSLFDIIYSTIDHVNLKLSIVDIPINTPPVDDPPPVDDQPPVPGKPGNTFILNSTTGDDIAVTESVTRFSNNSTIFNNKKSFANIAFDSNDVSSEIVFNDMPFLIRGGKGIHIEGNSFFLPQVVDINVYFTEISITDISRIIPTIPNSI